jgi:hypothetical protein
LIAELRAKVALGPRAFDFCILTATGTSGSLEAVPSWRIRNADNSLPVASSSVTMRSHGGCPASFGVRLPGCQVPDHLTRELGDPFERMLQAALGFRSSRACPSLPSAGTLGVSDAASASRTPGISLELPAPDVMDTRC